MADNATVTNKKSTFDANTNPDIATRAVEKNSLKSQVVIIDYGGAGAESLAVPDFATQTTLAALNAKVTAVNTGAVVISKTALTPSSPTTASVGVASASALAANANRKGLVLTNLSVNNISFGLGNAAVLNSGITLTPNGTWVMDEYTFCTSQIFAIAGGAASTLAIQEFA